MTTEAQPACPLAVPQRTRARLPTISAPGIGRGPRRAVLSQLADRRRIDVQRRLRSGLKAF